MRRTVDVIVVVVFLFSLFSIILLREGIGFRGPIGNVVSDEAQSVVHKSTLVFPNVQYDVRYCITHPGEGITVGLIPTDSKYEVVEKFTLENGYDSTRDATILYECEKSTVIRTIIED